MKKNLLLTPGPTKVPQNLCEALGRPIIHHRTPQFQEYLKQAFEGLKYVFQTKNDIYLMAGSGTAGMEAAVCNLLSPGDKAITVESGKFGERWTEICKAFGINTKVISVKWGQSVLAKDILRELKADPSIKAVFITSSETSTGITADVKAIGEAVRQTNAVLVVDAVSGLAVTELKTDEWGVDVVVSGSHKGLMLPPGLAFVSVSPKAYKLVETAQCPRYYFDFRKYKKAIASADTPFTPAIGLVIALIESINMIKTKKLENLLAHHERMAKATRAAVKALGLKLFADPSCISNVLTAVVVPDGVDGEKIVKIMRDTYGISIAGGQGEELKGKIIRIAHMGCVDEEDLLTGLEHLEKTLSDLGYKFAPRAGVEAFKEYLQGHKAEVTR